MTGKYTSPCYIILPPIHDRLHQRQEPFCVDHKTYAKLSTFVKYVIKFVGRANPITNFEFAEEYVKKNKRNTYLIFIFLPYPIPNLDYVSHTRFNCVVIAKPFRYLNYEEDYVSTAYLTTYLDFVVVTQSMSSQWGNKCGHYKISICGEICCTHIIFII